MTDKMTKAERDDLAKLVRRRERLAKADVDSVAADRRADFEAQLAKTYDLYSEEWRDAADRVRAAVDDLNAQIRREFEEKGIPTQFAPSADVTWWDRGENSFRDRRAELRQVAATRIAAEAKAARARIERASVEVQTRLIAAGLQSDEARRFLETMPTAEQLMPAAPTVAELEAEVPAGRGRHY